MKNSVKSMKSICSKKKCSKINMNRNKLKAINFSLYFTVVILFFFDFNHYKVGFVTNGCFNYLHGMSSHNSFERENSIRMPPRMACEILISLLCLDASMNFLTFHDVTCSIVCHSSKL